MSVYHGPQGGPSKTVGVGHPVGGSGQIAYRNKGVAAAHKRKLQDEAAARAEKKGE